MDAELNRIETRLRESLTEARARGIRLIHGGTVRFDDTGKVIAVCAVGSVLLDTRAEQYPYMAGLAELFGISEDTVRGIAVGWDYPPVAEVASADKWMVLGARLREDFEPVEAG
jgi:hypothetical protein